jgi:hypothetical protein
MIPSLTLFVHVVGVLTLFVGLATSLTRRPTRSTAVQGYR